MTMITPTIPHLLTLPLGLLPPLIPNTALVTILNRIFADALREEELDFMHRKVLLIRVLDAKLDFRLTLINDKLTACNQYQTHDLLIEGSAYDFLLLATRREDPDTLFFNRRLRLGGSTELGLYLKNFIDALEADEYWIKRLEGVTNIVELFGKIQAEFNFGKNINNLTRTT